jgi:type II secretory pathway pseudopilin PulG
LISAGRHLAPRRSGLTLVEVVAAVLIVAVVSGVIIPAVYRHFVSARTDIVVAELQSLETGILLFHRDVGRYPRRLDYLSVDALPAASRDACDRAMNAVNRNGYSGPYLSRPLTLRAFGSSPSDWTGYLLPTGDTIQGILLVNDLTVPGTGTATMLEIRVRGIPLADLEEIDRRVAGFSSG